jgi:hypothetical protein
VATVATGTTGGTVSAGGASTGGWCPTGLVSGDVEPAGGGGVVAGGGALTTCRAGDGLCRGDGAAVGSGAVRGRVTGGVSDGGAQHRQQCA